MMGCWIIRKIMYTWSDYAISVYIDDRKVTIPQDIVQMFYLKIFVSFF